MTAVLESAPPAAAGAAQDPWASGIPGMPDPMRSLMRRFPTLPSDDVILGKFQPTDRTVIERKLKVLSSIAYFVGRDFTVPVRPNLPGHGWYWDTERNEIRADAKDILLLPVDAARFIIAHEGAHRRISRIDVLDPRLRALPSFFFLVNCIEDPRVNNFILDSFPIFESALRCAFSAESLAIMEGNASKESGYVQEAVLGGLEYIYRWYELTTGEKLRPRSLPPRVAEVVDRTIDAAREAWSIYPSRAETLEGELPIRQYAAASARIIEQKVWPEFKKLVLGDLSNQLLQELLSELQGEQGTDVQGNGPGNEKAPGGTPLLDSIAKQLGREELDELRKKIQAGRDQAAADKELETLIDEWMDEQAEDEEADGNGAISPSKKEGVKRPDRSAEDGQASPIDLRTLSEKLQVTLKEIIQNFEPRFKDRLLKKAVGKLSGQHDRLSRNFRGNFGEAEGPVERTSGIPDLYSGAAADTGANLDSPQSPSDTAAEGRGQIRLDHSPWLGPRADVIVAQDYLPLPENGSELYVRYRTDVIEAINRLENDLRAVFRERRIKKWLAGSSRGPTIDLRKRISEIAKDVPVQETMAFKKRERPTEKDYAITLLVDLSGSMRGRKIAETVRAAIALAEVLGRLSINTEILGFNDRLYEYKSFHKTMSEEVRQRIPGMIEETCSSRASYNDDGWALAVASSRLSRQRAKEKFLIVLSDGCPAPSRQHSGPEFALSRVIEEIRRTSGQKLVGLGLGPDTQHVSSYYPNSLANIGVDEMSNSLAELLRRVIKEFDKFTI